MATSRKRVRIAAEPGAVHRALTDPAALRVWFAEHAEVELPVRYEFWGRFTPGGAAPHQRLLRSGDGSLSFEWDLDGVVTTVDITLEADGGSTLLTLVQTDVISWPQVVRDDAGDRGLMHTFWALALANLADYAEGREPAVRCDFTSPVFRDEMLIDADRPAVYEALAEPEQFSRWMGIRVEAEMYKGGRWAMGGFEANPHPAHIADLRPGRAMSIDWGDMVQTWELDDSAGRTRLTFFHSGFDEQQPPYSGWLGALAGLVELRRFLEIDGWRSMWVEVHVDGMPEGMVNAGG